MFVDMWNIMFCVSCTVLVATINNAFGDSYIFRQAYAKCWELLQYNKGV